MIKNNFAHTSLSATRLFVLLSLLLFTFTSCAGNSGSDSSTNTAPRVYVSSPDTSGMVTVTGTQNVAPGAGVVVGKNTTRLAASNTTVLPDTACTQDEAIAHEDGSFYSLSVCASADDSISVSYVEKDEPAVEIGTYVVPATPVQVCGADERAFAISNNTSEDIWLGVTAGTISCLSDSACPTGKAGSCVGANAAAGVAGTCGCSSNTDCGSIAQCNSNNKFCYWNLPPMGKGQMHLAKSAHTLLCFPAPQDSLPIQWSGNMFARTGCDAKGRHCLTGDCGSKANGPCPIGTGGNPPDTLLEFTLSNQKVSGFGPDFYDVSIINGLNVAASFSPVATTYSEDKSDPYSCKTPGNPVAEGKLSACSWKIEPKVNGVDQETLLKNVAAANISEIGSCPTGSTVNSLGYCKCSSNSDCSGANLECGLALNASKNQQYTKACGKKIGWWTADQICSSSINNVAPFVPYGEPLNCATTVQNNDGTTSNYTNFHICTKPADSNNPEQSQSCYNNAAVDDCCGCATSKDADYKDWPSVLNPSFGGSDNGCYAHNDNWKQIAQPWIVFLKKACPTAYTYPFDDATSTFTCRGEVGKVGPPTYSVSFFDTK